MTVFIQTSSIRADMKLYYIVYVTGLHLKCYFGKLNQISTDKYNLTFCFVYSNCLI